MLLARENPFRLDRVMCVRYRPVGTTLDAIVARFHAIGRRGAIVGPHGSGKTTLLEDLEARLRGAGERVYRLTPEECGARGALRADTLAGTVLTLDGAGVMSWRGRLGLRRLARQAGGLLLTAHRPTAVPTLFECRTSSALLESILRDLSPEPADPAWAAGLFARHRGNIRSALAEAYDRAAARPAP